MFKRMTPLTRFPNQTPDEFRKHWRSHGDLVMSLPNIVKYIHNDTLGNDDNISIDGFVELWFRTEADLIDAFSSEPAKLLKPDELKFIGGGRACDVEEIVAFDNAPTDASKIITVIDADDDSEESDWQDWQESSLEKAKAVGSIKAVTYNRILRTILKGSKVGYTKKLFAFISYKFNDSEEVKNCIRSGVLDEIEAVPNMSGLEINRFHVSEHLICNRI